MQLLQIEVINTSPVSSLPTEATLSLWSLLLKGGWVMLPILLLSVLAVYAILERLVVLYSVGRIPSQWLDDISAKIIAGDVQSVQMLCKSKRYAMARIIQAGIDKLHKPSKALEAAIENAGQREVYRLEKNLALLGTIAGAAPMLGFLGTVIGMIQAFMAMAQETHHISPKMLSGGIYEAMITTAAGLFVGILANLGYNYLLIRIQKATQRIEHASHQFIELVENHTKPVQNSQKHETAH